MSSIGKVSILALLGLAALTVTSWVGAQVLYGTVVGTVTDTGGSAIPGATVIVTATQTGQTRSTTTNNSGVLTISDLPAGTYSVEISASHFKKYAATAQVIANTVTRVDAEMAVGAASETVTVTGNAVVLQTDKADVHTDLTTSAVENLPLTNYRNYQSLINLVPGATPGAYQNSINDTPQRDLTTNVNGTDRNSNDTRVDGALDNMNVINSHVLYIPPAESIESVNISTATFDAEQGMAGGVNVTIITKSGTNKFHGSVFAMNTNNALQARNYFFVGTKAPKSIDNIDGFALGGPIKKDRLFFFADWEGLWEGKNDSLHSTVPTLDQRAGNFSAYGVTIYDPLTGNPNGTGRTPFVDAIIPPNRQSPIMLQLQSLVPLPNLPGTTNNYFSSGTQILTRQNYDLKIDFARTDKHRIWGKYSRMDGYVFCQPSLGAAGGIGLCTSNKAGTANTTTQLATLGHTWVLSPAALIDGTVSYFRMQQVITGPFYGTNFGSQTLGIPGTNGPDIKESGQPMFDIGGMSSLGDAGLGIANPGFRTDDGYTSTSNFVWNKGKHSFRFGFETIRYHQNDWQANAIGSVRGEFDFTEGVTALNGGAAPNQYNAYAAFLLGLPGSSAKDLQYYIPQTAREWQFAWYAQDRWQATRNLTLSIGLRSEYYPGFTRVNTGGMERYDPATNEVIIGGRGGNPDNVGIKAAPTFVPRLGINYRLGSDTVVRGGYGISTDPTSIWSANQRPYPVAFGSQFLGANSYTPFAPISQGIPPVSGPDISSGVVQLPIAAADTTLLPGTLRRGYIESYNLIVDRELPWNFVGTVGYVGTHSVRPLVWVNINAGSPGSGTAGLPEFAQFGRSGTTNLMEPIFGSVYNSLQATLNRQISSGLLMKGSYTYSRAIDFTDDEPASLAFNAPSQIPLNRGLAGYDRKHMVEMAWVYNLPFGPQNRWLAGRGLPSLLLRNWQSNGVFSAYSGTPFTVTASGTSLNAPGNTQTADQVKYPVDILHGIGPGHPWFDPTAFAPVTAVRFGNTRRDIIRGPGVVNINTSLFRDIPLSERFILQFAGDAFNLSNTPHFDNPNASVTSPSSFGIVTSASLQDQRYFRFGLKLTF